MNLIIIKCFAAFCFHDFWHNYFWYVKIFPSIVLATDFGVQYILDYPAPRLTGRVQQADTFYIIM